MCCSCIFLNEPATPEIYTLALHDALPILGVPGTRLLDDPRLGRDVEHERRVADALGVHDVELGLLEGRRDLVDRKSTRLNSSHANISYAVFCLKKKKWSRSRVTGRCPSEP